MVNSLHENLTKRREGSPECGATSQFVFKIVAFSYSTHQLILRNRTIVFVLIPRLGAYVSLVFHYKLHNAQSGLQLHQKAKI